MKTQSRDTHPEAERMQISIIREKSPVEKFAMIASLTATTIQLSKRAIKRANPDFNEKQINIRFIEIHYGKELADKYKQYLSQNPS